MGTPDQRLTGLLVMGLSLRLWRIDAALWYDEAFSAWLAKLPPGRLIEATLGDVHPPLYYLLLAGAGRLFGFSEIALRLPSVAAGVLLIYLVYRLAQNLFDDRIALISAAITAIAPFQVYYSQEARFYALQTTLVTTAAIGLVERRQWLLIVASLAALYLHNMSALFVAAIFLAAVRGLPRWLIVSGLAVAVGYLPGLVMACRQLATVNGGYWIPDPHPGRLIATLDDLIFLSPQSTFVLAGSLLTSTALILIAVSPLWRQRAGQTLLLLASVPLLSALAISALWQPILLSRTMAPAAPFLYILIAACITPRRRLIVWGGSAVLISVFILFVGPLAGTSGRQPLDQELLTFWGELQAGDSVYHANLGSYIVWEYYRPEINQYVWPQDSTLEQSLTLETRRTMAIREGLFESIRCTKPTNRWPWSGRWFLIYFHNPTTVKEEIKYVNHLIADYPSREIKVIRSDPTVEARVYLLEPACPELAQFKLAFICFITSF